MDQNTLFLPYKRFLANILSEFRLSAYNDPRTSTDCPIEFRALARVIDGKLYLKRMWKSPYKKSDKGTSAMIEGIFGSLQICPHLNTSLQPTKGQPRAMLVEWMRLMYATIDAVHCPKKDRRASCPSCTTDLILYCNKDYISITAWQLLGGCDLDSWKYWEGHAWKGDGDLPLKYSDDKARYDQEDGDVMAAFEQNKEGKFVRW